MSPPLGNDGKGRDAWFPVASLIARTYLNDPFRNYILFMIRNRLSPLDVLRVRRTVFWYWSCFCGRASGKHFDSPVASHQTRIALGSVRNCHYYHEAVEQPAQNFCEGPNQARNQGGGFGAFSPPKFSKHCVAILAFVETFKELRGNFMF